MSPEEFVLLEELKRRIEDERRRALVDAYLRKPTAQSIADEALKILAGAIDANQSA